jgi:hypothetical protein
MSGVQGTNNAGIADEIQAFLNGKEVTTEIKGPDPEVWFPGYELLRSPVEEDLTSSIKGPNTSTRGDER